MTKILPEHIETEVSDPTVMESNPLVSVLMSVYNHGKYLAEAIEGVISQQTDFPIELIVGEDCSNDDSRAIAIEYQKRYPHIIRLVYSDKNLGAYSNANRCFAKVRGKFVAWCEGDDYWNDSQKLRKQVTFLQDNPDYGMVHSDYDYLVFLLGKWKKIPHTNRPKRKVVPQGDVYTDLLKNMFVRTCTMVGRTRLLKEHYSSSLRSSSHVVGDRPIALHMSRLAKIGYIDEPLATYRRSPDSMTNSGRQSNLQMRKKRLGMYRNFFLEFGQEESEWMETQKSHYRDILKFALLAKSRTDYLEALEWLECNDKNFIQTPKILFATSLIRIPFLLSCMVFLIDTYREVQLIVKSRGGAVNGTS